MNHSTAAEEPEIQHKNAVKEHQACVNSLKWMLLATVLFLVELDTFAQR